MVTANNRTTGAEPPWTLTGSANIVFYRFSADFVNKRMVVPEGLEGMFLGGIGALGLVEYVTSPVGPYRELWFSPGQFAFGSRKYHSITHMYVTTTPGMEAGRAYWGLPKTIAEIDRSDENGVDQWRVFKDGHLLLDVAFRPGRLSLPVWSWMVRPRIMQHWNGQHYLTRLRCNARVRLTDLSQPQGRSPEFPDLSHARPIGAVNLPRFRLIMPAARVGD